MKKTLFFAAVCFGSMLYACTGDCLSCHPSLLPTIEKDPRHRPMLGCIKCHRPETDAMAECGSDCFVCHPVEKIESRGIAAHKPIRGCRDCHMKLKAEMTDISTPSDQSLRPTLRDLLQPETENGIGGY